MQLGLGKGLSRNYAPSGSGGGASLHASDALFVDFVSGDYWNSGTQYDAIADMPGYSASAAPTIDADGFLSDGTSLLKVGLPAYSGDLLIFQHIKFAGLNVNDYHWQLTLSQGVGAVNAISQYFAASWLRVEAYVDSVNVYNPATGASDDSPFQPASTDEFTGIIRYLSGVWSFHIVRDDGVLHTHHSTATAAFPAGMDTLTFGNWVAGGYPLGGHVQRTCIKLGTFADDAAIKTALGF